LANALHATAIPRAKDFSEGVLQRALRRSSKKSQSLGQGTNGAEVLADSRR